LLAGDADDDRLLSHVHPSDWTNPTAKSRYHLVVIGAGTGGLVTAAAAAGLGARVALIERHLMGGDCLNVGCVPSKAVIRAARAWHEARAGGERFGAPTAVGDGDFGAVMARLRRLRADLSPIDGAPRFRDLGIDVFLGDGRFVGADAVDVGGERLTFRRAVIATGARAAIPPIPGLSSTPYYTNESIFTLTSRPQHLVVLGAGPIGCELAQAFARLGTHVTLINRDLQLMPREDADAAAIVEQSMRRDGVSIRHATAVQRVEHRGGETRITISTDGTEHLLICDALLVAIGRAPNVNGLDLERAGVAYDARRGVTVDDRLRTSNAKIFAVGDVCSSQQFTHSADFQARLVVQNALFFGRGKASALVTPRVTYTSPEVASVGFSERDAIAKGIAVDVVTVPLHDVDRARLDDETDGFCRMVLARGTDRIVGATLVAEHAGENIGEVALAMTSKLGLSAIGRTMHPYPTQGEMLRKAADSWRRRKLTPTVKAIFARYFRWLS
jgi:pyruvate/2-oxoglutarate dehydrogenase complex dihydrolipoamide dehydrogenase (E3) component